MRRKPLRRRGQRFAVKRDAAPPASPPQRYEVEVVRGLEEYARREIRRRLGKGAHLEDSAVDGRIMLRYDGSIRRFDELRAVAAVHRVEDFAAPRPRALLGHQHLTRLLAAIGSVMDARRSGSYRTFRIAGAGAGTGVFMRLRNEIAAATKLEATNAAAHLQVTVRRGDEGGWQALIRTSAMPLSARRWRVRDMPGALNATVASVMASLGGARPAERMLNICCGSGTLMVERLGMGKAQSVTGVDISPTSLQYADSNLRAAGHRSSVELALGDCGRLPISDASVDTILADLPYGMLEGSGDIAGLYGAALAEADRVGAADASLVVITTRKRALLGALDVVRSWDTHAAIPISLPHSGGYITPQIYLLRRGKDFRARL